jgi:hypothetical protein
MNIPQIQRYSQPASYFEANRCGKLKYHGDGEECQIISSSLLPLKACRDIIEMCEIHAKLLPDGWSGESRSQYRYATTDLEVVLVPVLRDWLKHIDFMAEISRRILWGHGLNILELDDMFVIKYDATVAGKQCELSRHVDAGDVSFMLMLSDSKDFEGGGTSFDILGDHVLSLAQGELLTFDASLYHRGVAITSGLRYLLVGFCIANKVSCGRTGNISLDLEVVEGSHTPLPHLARTWTCLDDAHSLIASARREACCLAELANGKTFWLSMNGGHCLRCSLEALVRQIYELHIPANSSTVSEDAGAEFWVQVCNTHESIPFHFDKDEIESRHGKSPIETWLHPRLSTVTYLSNGGSPTVIFDTVGKQTVKDSTHFRHSPPTQAFVSFPRIGKHLAFSGKLLHGTAPELCTSRTAESPRITLLVNVWTRRRPLGVDIVPSKTVDAMLGGNHYSSSLQTTVNRPLKRRVIGESGSMGAPEICTRSCAFESFPESAEIIDARKFTSGVWGLLAGHIDGAMQRLPLPFLFDLEQRSQRQQGRSDAAFSSNLPTQPSSYLINYS